MFHWLFSFSKRNPPRSGMKPPSRQSRWPFSTQKSFYSNKFFSRLSARRRGILVYSVCSVDSKILIFRATIFHFLVFLKRFSLPVSSSNVTRLMSYRLSSPLVSRLASHVPPHEKAIQIAPPWRCFDARRETRDVHKDMRRLDKETQLIVLVAAINHSKLFVPFVVPVQWFGCGQRPLHAFRTTIVDFLVFLKRFSPKPRATAWDSLPLAKRRQPPSRRSRWPFSTQKSFYSNKFFSRLSARRRGILVYSVCSVDSSFVFIRVHSWFKIKYFQLLVRRINNVTSGRASTLNGGPHVPVPGDVYIFKPSGNS